MRIGTTVWGVSYMKYSFRASHYTNGANVPKVVYPWHYTIFQVLLWYDKCYLKQHWHVGMDDDASTF